MTNSKSKYRAVKTDGYDSKAEARRGRELELLERAGKIENLGKQVKFEIIPPQKDAEGKVIERAAYYIADFVYTDPSTGKEIVEDVKSPATRKLPVYVLKRKLMRLAWGIEIREVA